MIKIRQTIYGDPGNPFQDELDAERAARGEQDSVLDKALPEAPDEVSPTGRSFFEIDMSDGPFQSSSEARCEAGRSLPPLETSWRYEESESSPTARSCRFSSGDVDSSYDSVADQLRQALEEPTNPSIAAQEDTQRTRPEYSRSMSLAVPKSPPLGDEYVSPRRFWRRENSLPLMKEAPEEREASPCPKSARDTGFYGFYEDLMKDYKRRSKL